MSELLDLATVVERDTVRIRTKRNPDGKLYELVNPDELGPFEYAIISSRHEKLNRFQQRTDRKPTAAEERELRKTLGDILKLLLPDLEPGVLAEMENTARARIVTAWAMTVNAGAAEGEAPASPSTTAGSSRASKRSTAATRKPGSTRPRGS